MSAFPSRLGWFAAQGSSGFQVANSCRFQSANSCYLTRTASVAGSQRIATYRFLVRRSALGAEQELVQILRTSSANPALFIRFTSGDKIDISCQNDVPAVILRRTTTRLFRDTSAWYDICVRIDGNQTTDACCTLEINGVTETAFDTKTNLGSATDLNLFNTSKALNLFRNPGAVSYLDGYVGGNTLIVDGTAYAASNFGEVGNTPGSWRPKAITGVTYGTNGVLFDFANSAALGTNTSGNGNTFTSSGLTTGDQVTDTPTTNYPTLNPLDVHGGSVTYTQGNLDGSGTGSTSVSSVALPSSGKRYFEAKLIALSSGNAIVGLVDSTGTLDGTATTRGYQSNGQKNNGSTAAYGATYTINDTIGIAANMDTGDLTFYKNNVSQGTAYSDLISAGVQWFFAVRFGTGGEWQVNFGQKTFTYTPPTGFTALNTANLPTPASAASVTPKTGSFTGNGAVDGPFVWLGYTPDESGTSTINGNVITWGTHARSTAGGFKVISSSASYNTSGSNTFSIAVVRPFGGQNTTPAVAR